MAGFTAVLREMGYRVSAVPFPVSWTVKMKKKQKETQDILSYHTQAAGCSDKARAKAVSYTHLDVYKRQILRKPAQLPN